MDFYYFLGSTPSHAVLMAAKAFGVDLNLKRIDLLSKEHLKPEFIKLNPQHTVPTLVDNGFVLCESRAILIYLAEKYDKTNSLYPNCPMKRAVINQRLFFDLGTLYQRFAEYYYTLIFGNTAPHPEKYKKMEEAVGFFETFLTGQIYAAGDNLSLADISLVATISIYKVCGFDLSKCPNITRWFEQCKKTVPGYNITQEGCEEFKKIFIKKKPY